MSVQKPSDQNRPSSSVLPATREVSPKPTRRTRKPPTKRLKTDLKADEDEDSDHKAISIAKDVKGKGRAANPVDPMPVDMDSEGSDSEAKPWDEYGDCKLGSVISCACQVLNKENRYTWSICKAKCYLSSCPCSSTLCK